MTDIRLSESQGRAVDQIRRWLPTAHDGKQVFRLFGYAGTGKTTILKHVIDELGLRDGDVAYGAFTGKAAFVMERNGLHGASTCHRLTYIPSHASEDAVKQERDKLKQMRADKVDRTLILEQRKKIDRMLTPSWHLNDDSPIANVKLLVLDEVSMLDRFIATDMLSFGTPILVVGDPGQLPPIRSEKGEGYFMKDKPDVMLTRIHRQALDSPILRLATMAREGKRIPIGKFGNGVRKVAQINKTETYLKYDQILCGRNATRYGLNRRIRKYLGYEGRYPTSEAEKIICLKNDYDIGILNGEFLVFENPQRVSRDYVEADIHDEEGNLVVAKAMIYAGEFAQHYKFRKNRAKEDTFKRRGYVEATYGWAITCHKSQGSQWKKLMVFDESFCWRGRERWQWLYTAITRAEERLTIVA